MTNNPSFTEDLNVRYLSLLAKYDKPEEFAGLYNKTAATLFVSIDDKADREELDALKEIIDYKKQQTLKEGMRK